MSLEKQFSRKLDQLWRRRTAALRSLVISQGSGKLPQFTRKVRERLIGGLLDDATALLLKREGRSEFKKLIEHRHLRQIRGHGLLERGDNLTEWAARKLRGPIVYAFWRGRKCLYVGKGRNWKRLRAYSKSHYLYQAASIEVFRVVGKSQLAKAECLATHLFRPSHRKMSPSKVRWGKACPICQKHDHIRHELRSIFKMK